MGAPAAVSDSGELLTRSSASSSLTASDVKSIADRTASLSDVAIHQDSYVRGVVSQLQANCHPGLPTPNTDAFLPGELQ